MIHGWRSKRKGAEGSTNSSQTEKRAKGRDKFLRGIFHAKEMEAAVLRKGKGRMKRMKEHYGDIKFQTSTMINTKYHSRETVKKKQNRKKKLAQKPRFQNAPSYESVRRWHQGAKVVKGENEYLRNSGG